MEKIKEIHYYEISSTIYSNVYSFNDDTIVIVNHNITNIPENQIIFNYETYTQKQNELMSSHKICFRFHSWTNSLNARIINTTCLK